VGQGAGRHRGNNPNHHQLHRAKAILRAVETYKEGWTIEFDYKTIVDPDDKDKKRVDLWLKVTDPDGNVKFQESFSVETKIML
jgi:hypothetical protein